MPVRHYSDLIFITSNVLFWKEAGSSISESELATALFYVTLYHCQTYMPGAIKMRLSVQRKLKSKCSLFLF